MEFSAVLGQALELREEPERRRYLADQLPDLDAEGFLRFLKAEAERYWGIDPLVSLAVAETLSTAADLAGEPRHAALGLMAQGDALRLLGRHQEARTTLDEAGGAFLALGDEVGWARTRIGWLFSSHYVGEGAVALAVVEPARAILIRHAEWLRAAGLCLNAATVSQEIGDYDQALRLYDDALGYFERARHSDPTLADVAELRAAKAQANKATVLLLRGDFQTALRLHEAARATFARQGQTLSVLLQDQNIADVYAGQGHYARALRLYGDAITGQVAGNQPFEAALSTFSLIECYLNLNLDDRALELAQELVAQFEAFGSPTETARARVYDALALIRQGDAAAALAQLQAAAEVFATAGLTTQSATVALYRGQLYRHEQEWGAALGQARQAVGLFAERGLPLRRAQAELLAASAAAHLGLADEAARLAPAALALAESLDVPWLVQEVSHLVGNLAEGRQDFPAAITAYESAMRSIERVQGRLPFELSPYFLDNKLQVYRDALTCYLRLGDAEGALACLERAKSRSLADYLASHADVRPRARRPANQALLDEVARLREEYNWFYSRLYSHRLGALAGADDGGDGDLSARDEAALRAGLAARERDMRRLLERLAVADEGLDGEAGPVSREAARPTLDGRTVLLEYYIDAQRAVVFVVTAARLEVVPLDVCAAEVEALLRNWRLNIETTSWAAAQQRPLGSLAATGRRLLQTLYDKLLRPLVGHLAAYERVVVVPYGVTHTVPFHALHDGTRYLIEGWDVSYCPSSRLLQLCAQADARPLSSALVLAYSQHGQLPYVLEEARAVVELLGGESYVEDEATRATLLARQRQHGILHLAAHGEPRLDNPTFAHVALADGPLNLSDVLNLELQGALVTLSACDTGRGVVTGGDELVGLSRGFLHAGAVTLVQSLWQVQDQAAADLMRCFYQTLRDGQARSEALRAAQRMLLANHGEHPYFWAPFQLIGAGDSPAAFHPANVPDTEEVDS